MAQWPEQLPLPKHQQYTLGKEGPGQQQEHPFAARSAPLKSGSSLVTFGGFWGKNTNQLLSQTWGIPMFD